MESVAEGAHFDGIGASGRHADASCYHVEPQWLAFHINLVQHATPVVLLLRSFSAYHAVVGAPAASDDAGNLP